MIIGWGVLIFPTLNPNLMDTYIKKLFKTLLLACNPSPRELYGSKMLSNGGRLELKIPKNIDNLVVSNNDFQKITEQ